jgi:hypothetical protein
VPGAKSAVSPIGSTARSKIMNNEANMTIADLDVELSAIGGYDSVSGMPCGCLAGPVHPFIRPEGAGDVASLVSA